MQTVQLTLLTEFLGGYFNVHLYPTNEQGGVYRTTHRPVSQLGLTLEPTPELANWVNTQALDALWIHRPWQLDQSVLPTDMGILYHHLPFDEHLTLGFNQRLAAVLNLTALQEIGYKQAPNLPQRPIGMLGDRSEQTFSDWLAITGAVFGGYENAIPGQHEILNRVAVVGAMNDALVREAAGRGVGLYITGQYRRPADKAVAETGMTVIEVGHRRSEEWGLRALAGILQERWAELQVFVL